MQCLPRRKQPQLVATENQALVETLEVGSKRCGTIIHTVRSRPLALPSLPLKLGLNYNLVFTVQ
eukprot:COSAG03_NODE_102_length_12788_cov_8.752384_11_plen_64_part_00